MAHLDLLKTVHLPVTDDGSYIKDASGVVIAEARDSITAYAMVQLMNLAQPVAEVQQNLYEQFEERKAQMFARRLKD